MTSVPLDQTRGDSTPYIKDGQAASLSINEAAALCMKAARGAGMSWGLAEEAGFAAAWLVHQGIDGANHLYAHLDGIKDRTWDDLRPLVTAGEWRAAPDQTLCPIALGATLCDYVGLAEGIVVDSSLKIGKVDHPVLLIPFLSEIAVSNDILFEIECPPGTLRLDGGPDALATAAAALDGQQMAITLTARSGKLPAAQRCKAPEISADTIAELNTLAMRTTVPSSESSRAGAGSTTTDND
ncbi:MAG: DUF3726 domain-containing protein [Sulfitobacter sp.]